MSDEVENEAEMAGRRPASAGRRALMLGAAAAGAAAAATVAGGGVADAATTNGKPILLGKSNTASASTSIVSSKDNGLSGQTKTVGFSGLAGIDVTPTKGAHGTYGQSNFGTGVLGVSFHATGVTGFASTEGASGVSAENTAKGGFGLFGQANEGTSVYGTSTNGTGVHASSAHGTALEVSGKTKFSRSGLTIIRGGSRTATVHVDGLTSASIVLATIQRPQAGLALAGALAAEGSFELHLSGPAPADVPVGWLILD
jgi:hypothetical protein